MKDHLLQIRPARKQDSLFAPVASMGRSAVVAAGPWLFSILALKIINEASATLVATQTLEIFRVFMIYAFGLSLIATAPIAIITTRLTGDHIYSGQRQRIRPLLLAAIVLGACVSVLLPAILYGPVFGATGSLMVAGVSCSAWVGLIWISLSFCGALRDHEGISVSFLIGLVVAVVATLAAAALDQSAAGMLWGASAGLCVTFALLTTRALAALPYPVTDLLDPIIEILEGMHRHWHLALGALLSAIAIWIDKWIIWAGPIGQPVHGAGLIHAPLYDGAMFYAYLTIIPSLTLFVSQLDTIFMPGYRAYYDSISGHGTSTRISENAAALKLKTTNMLTHILLVQVALSAIVVLAAPIIISTFGMQYQQIGILRLGAIGVIFQFLFLACSSLLLFFGRDRSCLLLQGVFLVLQASLTLVTVLLGPRYYGLGYLAACVVSGALSFILLEHSMRQISYLTFIVDNSRRSGVKPVRIAERNSKSPMRSVGSG